MLKKIKINKVLLIIIGVGLLLRYLGTSYGFPFIFHPDEPALVRSATGIRFDSNPAHFDWPHLHYYLNFGVYWLFMKFRGLLQVLGLRVTLSRIFPLMWGDPLVFYFVSRVFNVFIGALTAIPVFLASKNLFNKKVGYIAAAALMVLPHHLYTSAFALIDIPTAFWVAWAFYFSTKIYKEGNLKDYLLAGFFIGLAASTKYNGGLMAFMVPVAHILRVWGSKISEILSLRAFKALFLSGLLAAFGFILGTPYALFDYDTFSRTDGPQGAYWQFTNVGKVDLPTQVTQFIGSVSYDAFGNYGHTFIILYLAAIAYGVFIKRDRRLWLILIPSLILFFYISGFIKTRAHYYTSVYPLVAIAVGYMSYLITKKLPSKLKYLVLILIFSIPTYFSYQYIQKLVRPDTRVELYEWLKDTLVHGDHLYYTSSGMLPVMKKFSDFEVDKGLTDRVFDDSGYILVGLNEEERGWFIQGIHPDMEILRKFDKILEIDASGRKGTYIIIYEYGKDQEI